MLLNVRLLGPFEAVRDGDSIPYHAWGRRKTLALAKLLIAHRGVVFSHGQLIELLYEGAPTEGAVSNLYRRVSELRRALEPDLRDGRRSLFVRQQGRTYVFRREAPCQVDVERFLEAIAIARDHRNEHQNAAALRPLRDAVNLYRGDFLEEDRYLEWTQAPRARLREEYLEALSQLAMCHAELGEYEPSIDACRRVLDIQPHREPVIRQLMEYYAAAGDRSKAIATYNEGVRALAETLDVQPEAETSQLFKDIARRSEHPGRGTLSRKRIAVLPFTHAGETPSDRLLAEGLTEQVVHALSNVPHFGVVSSTSAARFAHERASLARIGKGLRVGSVVEGSVRVRDDRVRISASLSNVETEERVWSQTYDRQRSELLSLQDEIAERIVGALRLELGGEDLPRLQETQTRSWEAYELYVIGRHHWSRRSPEGYQAAAESFEKALSFDANYSNAHAGLAATLCDLGESSRLPELRKSYGESAERAAKRALELDPHCAEARATLGRNRMYFERDPLAAEREIREAIRLNPSYAMACNWLGVVLVGLARFDEAIDALHRAHRLDPLSLAILRNLARAYYSARRYDEAIGELRKAIGLDTHFAELHLLLGLIYLELARHDEAIAEFEQERLLAARRPTSSEALISITQAREGACDRLNCFVNDLRTVTPDSLNSSELVWITAALLEAGEESRACACLRNALELSLGWFMLYVHSPLLDSASSKGWYVSLLQKAGLVSP